jgi:hypothetical protein
MIPWTQRLLNDILAIPYRINFKPSMVSYMIALVPKHLEVLNGVIEGVSVLMVDDITRLQLYVCGNNSSSGTLPLPALDIHSSSSSFKESVITFVRAKYVEISANLASSLLKLFAACKARNIQSTLLAGIYSVAFKKFKDTLTAYSKPVGNRDHGFKVIGVALYCVNFLQTRQSCSHKAPLYMG